MNWFMIALIPPALWAATNHVDKFLISKHFKGGGAGALTIVSSLITAITLPVIALVHPGMLSVAPIHIAILAINGSTSILGLLLYFRAMQRDEASVVIPLFQFIPVFSYLLGYFVLGETLTAREFIAFAVILLGAILVSLDLNEKIRLKSDVLLLMIAASIVNAGYGIIFKMVAKTEGYLPSIFWSFAGLTTGAILLFTFASSFRKDFLSLFKRNSLKYIGINVASESLSMLSIFIEDFAMLLAPVALVSVVGSFQSVFVFIYGIILTIFLPNFNSESLVGKHLLQRITAIAIILFGVYLLRQ